jgi:hypothetical protein
VTAPIVKKIIPKGMKIKLAPSIQPEAPSYHSEQPPRPSSAKPNLIVLSKQLIRKEPQQQQVNHSMEKQPLILKIQGGQRIIKMIRQQQQESKMATPQTHGGKTEPPKQVVQRRRAP